MRWVKYTDWLSSALVTIGGLNLGFVGFFNYDLLAKLLGGGSTLYRVVFAIIGLAAIYVISFMYRLMAPASTHSHA